jgi:hypothetical protein
VLLPAHVTRNAFAAPTDAVRHLGERDPALAMLYRILAAFKHNRIEPILDILPIPTTHFQSIDAQDRHDRTPGKLAYDFVAPFERLNYSSRCCRHSFIGWFIEEVRPKLLPDR